MKKESKGITLIALVITIIVLLILAGITINLTIGQRGILNRAQEVGRNYQEATKREDEELSNFLKEADEIINGITENGGEIIPSTPEISEEVKRLKVGDYIKYDTGVTSVGENITLGGSTWEAEKVAYNGAIERLNNEAQHYVNEEYAYDGRCVGSIPTVQKGMFVEQNKVRDGEGNIQDKLATVSIPETYTIPAGWTSRDTWCSDTDTNYMIDKTVLERANMWITGQYYWLASRDVVSYSSGVDFNVYIVDTSDGLSSYNICIVISDGHTYGASYTHGLRPCISLKSDVIRITGGDGTSEDTAYTIGI